MDDELEVLGVDPAYMCLPNVDHANLFQVGEQLRGVSKVCQETGAMLLLAHHTRKTKIDPFSPPELEDIAWAGFQEFCPAVVACWQAGTVPARQRRTSDVAVCGRKCWA